MSSQQTNIAMQKDVKSVGVSGIRKVGVEPVYNMEVEGTHCFAANGLIVHNCMDAARYCVNTMLRYNMRGYI